MNQLFICADQMHAFALGCMGNSEIQTPNLDALAAGGRLFRNCYSNAPVCTPFRAMLFSGRYPHQTGIYGNNARLPPGEAALADFLNAAGVRTSYVGKWHLGGTGDIGVEPHLRGGFTEFSGYQCYNSFWRDVNFHEEDGGLRSFDGHRGDATTQVALDRLTRLSSRGEPFALFVSYQEPHYPMEPGSEFEAIYAARNLTLRPNCRDVEPYTPTFSPPSPTPRELDPNFQKYGGDLDEYLRLYYALVSHLDHNVGRLISALDELGLRDSTAVVFTSDHGDMQGSHGLTNKCFAYEESTRIPLIIRLPGETAAMDETLVSGIDFFPTCLELGNAPCPSDRPGRSLLAACRDQPMPVLPVFAELAEWAMVRDGDWKLVIHRPAGDAVELFNLRDDPFELNNLIASENCAGVRNQLKCAITGWLAT